MSSSDLEVEMKAFVSAVNQSDVAAFCVMDYWTFDWYLELLKYKTKFPGELQKPVFPGIELRIECPVDYRLNIHCILSDKLSFQEIADFKSQLTIRSIDKKLSNESLKQFAKSLDESKAKKHGFQNPSTLDDERLLQLGSKTAEITKESLEEAFKQIPNENGYIILPYDTSDGLLDLDWADHPHDDNYFMQSADVFEARDPRNIDLLNGKKTPENEPFFKNFFKTLGNKPKPCISGSDAHKYSDFGNFPSDRVTWIKADPTFEGFSQIIFEPTERVRIQATNPSLDYDRPFFSSVTVTQDEVIFEEEDDLIFAKNETGIPLNQNLVAIVGGRGEGKSMLTDYLATSFMGQSHSKDGTFRKSGYVNVQYFKTNQSENEVLNFPLKEPKHALDFLYINQGSLKNIVEKKDKQSSLANSIRRLAKLDEPVFSPEINDSALSAVNELHQLTLFLETKDEKGEEKNSIQFLEQQEASIKQFIDNITTTENKDKLTRYSENLSSINALSEKKNKLIELEEEIRSLATRINVNIEAVDPGASRLPKVSETLFTAQIEAILKWKSEIDSEVEALLESTRRVKEEFGDYRGDLTTLLKDVDKFQNSLFDVKKTLEDTRKKILRHETLKKQLFNDDLDNVSLASKIQSDYERQQKKLTNDWLLFTKIDDRGDLNEAQKTIMKNLLDDLSIDVIVDFDEDAFYDETSNSINGAIWRVKTNKDAQKQWFNIIDLESFFKFLKERYYDSYNNEPAFYKDTFSRIFFDESIRKKFIKVYPILKYQGRDLGKISVGQKGTVYLKMMLATEAFSKPIIFDQPEDDLDNEFIMEDLVDLFKKLKRYRQVIIITHNANLVVNADAEQIIISKNDKGRLAYSSGSLENNSINSNICRILEGGEIAFERRRSKYRYPKMRY
ncbi:MAG: hypothetical protein WD824_17810 [Cyclobacteriaceae bacterium]